MDRVVDRMVDRVVDPATGETLAEVPRTDAAGAGAAIAAARAAFEDWRRRPHLWGAPGRTTAT